MSKKTEDVEVVEEEKVERFEYTVEHYVIDNLYPDINPPETTVFDTKEEAEKFIDLFKSNKGLMEGRDTAIAKIIDVKSVGFY